MLKIDSNYQEIKLAKTAHELFTINIMVVHLFLSLALIKIFSFSMSMAIFSVIGVSSLIITYTYFQVNKLKSSPKSLSYLHWQLSFNRYKMIIISYICYFIILLIGSFFDNGKTGMDGSSIVEAITMRLSIIPVFIAVLLGAVLGSGSVFNAGRSEISKKFAKKYAQ